MSDSTVGGAMYQAWILAPALASSQWQARVSQKGGREGARPRLRDVLDQGVLQRANVHVLHGDMRARGDRGRRARGLAENHPLRLQADGAESTVACAAAAVGMPA